MLAAEGLPAVMSGHLAFPKTEAANAPASLSPWFLNEVLRKKIGYKGVIITDDLMMNGATIYAGSISRAAKQALLAGNDIILFSKTPNLLDPVWTYLSSSMKDDNEFRLRVRDAARRILAMKLRYLRGNQAVPLIPDLRKVETELVDPAGSAFFLNLAARSVTVVKPSQTVENGKPGESAVLDPVFPLTPENAGNILLTGQFLDFFKAGKIAFPDAASFWYSSSGNLTELLSQARRADTIIFCLSDAAGVRVLRQIEPLKKKVIVISVLSPVYLESVPWVDGAIAVYSYTPESLSAGFSVITGRITAEGKLPYD
jgi:beta-N-acetylhexosaminidase